MGINMPEEDHMMDIADTEHHVNPDDEMAKAI